MFNPGINSPSNIKIENLGAFQLIKAYLLNIYYFIIKARNALNEILKREKGNRREASNCKCIRNKE